MDKGNKQKEGNQGKEPVGSMGRQDSSRNNPPVNEEHQNVSKNPAEVHPGGSRIDDTKPKVDDDDDGGYDSQGNLKRKREDSAVGDDSSAGSKKSMLVTACDWESDGSKLCPTSHPGDESSSQKLPVSQSTGKSKEAHEDELQKTTDSEKSADQKKTTDSGYRDFFDQLDGDKDGCVTVGELWKAVMIETDSDSIDAEGQGMMNQDEFDPEVKLDFPAYMKMLEPIFQGASASDSGEELIIKDFEEFDEGRTGFISAADFRHVMTKVFNEEVDEMIKEADPDGSGLINYKEYVKKLYGKQ
ncbi:OLC1v1017757C1 [Oldenlandia corymbosa var. corymbosa]|uniref:OLC1v1017757C1 n=1 Tax=Oldenlandia corymbosa var. corymbosa TaxID=529605 RepID=A0AAV1EAF6_OLDCO|nr:OLC1v1017757C1 [Oldenlandia corymbosa var. corymbosa]